MSATNFRDKIASKFKYDGKKLALIISLLLFADSKQTNNAFMKTYNYIILARTPEIGQGLCRILSCGARKPEQT